MRSPLSAVQLVIQRPLFLLTPASPGRRPHGHRKRRRIGVSRRQAVQGRVQVPAVAQESVRESRFFFFRSFPLSLPSAPVTVVRPFSSALGRGILSMANSGPDTNKSQVRRGPQANAKPPERRVPAEHTSPPPRSPFKFFITYRPCTYLDKKHTVFGHVVGGMDTLANMESIETGAEDRPKRVGRPARRRRAGVIRDVPPPNSLPLSLSSPRRPTDHQNHRRDGVPRPVPGGGGRKGASGSSGPRQGGGHVAGSRDSQGRVLRDTQLSPAPLDALSVTRRVLPAPAVFCRSSTRALASTLAAWPRTAKQSDQRRVRRRQLQNARAVGAGLPASHTAFVVTIAAAPPSEQPALKETKSLQAAKKVKKKGGFGDFSAW